jgi:hypothetical protein
MKQAKEIESLAKRTQFEPDASADRRILSAAEAALDRRMDAARAGEARLTGRLTMKRTIAKLAIAATVIAAALLGIHFFSGTSGTSWAAVLQKVSGFDTCVYRWRTVETSGPRPNGFEFTTDEEHRIRRSEVYGSFTENYENDKLTGLDYCLLQDKQNVTLDPRSKVCRRGTLTEKGLQEFDYYYPKRTVMKILEGNYTELGQDTIGGKVVRGIEVRDPNALADETHPMPPAEDFSARFWIEPDTLLPIWVEISAVFKGSPTRVTAVWDQFEWGVPLEASVFTPDIPADYKVVDEVPHQYPPKPDPTPRTDVENAFVQNSIDEPYLGDFDALPLPDVSHLSLLGTDPGASKPQVTLRGQTEIRIAHDACVAKWPRYEQVQAQLRQELQAKLSIEAMDVNGLVTTAIALRNAFWGLGGCLSDTAYPYVYAARLLDEIAHEKAPDNPAVIDQLLESIMSYEVYYYWSDPEPEHPVRNPMYSGLMADLRYQQFALLRAKIGQGYVPTWKDFVRSCDVMTLSRLRKDKAADQEATRLLIEQTPRAGWTYYLARLQRHEQGQSAEPVTFVGGMTDVSFEQYGRRLWCFQGPQELRQARTAAHLEHLKK